MKTNNVFINPLTDFGFKKVFCTTERGSRRLTSFLRAFLPDIMRDVVSITFRPTEILGEREAEKKVVFDIYCVTDTGRHIIIEMQRAERSFFSNRILTYSSRVLSSEAMRGDMEYNIPTVISFNILDYDSNEFSRYEDAFHIVKLKDEKNAVYSEKTVFCFLELTKFAARKQFEQLSDDRQKWCYAIKNMWRLEEDDIPEEYDIFHELYEECKLSKLTTMEKQEYGKSVLEYEDVKEAMEYHHRMGRTEGFEKGYGLGVEKGIQQGIEQGKQQLVRNMLAKGLDPAQVADLTGIDLQEVRAMTE